MPRNLGTGIYTRPAGIDAIPGETIESDSYNTNVQDVEFDLNSPRPIVAGGTNGTDINSAAVNLKTDRSWQKITDYASNRFYPGSFYSDKDATDSPIAGHTFAGICYVLDDPPTPASAAPINKFITIEARDFDDANNPPLKYVRQKRDGTWGNWFTETVGPPGTTLDNTKVALAGGTGAIMTGFLTLSADPANDLHAATKHYVDTHGGGGTGGGDGIPEAPTDGQLYGRKSSAWSVVPSSTGTGGVGEAPTDGQTYGRVGSTHSWLAIPTFSGTLTSPVTIGTSNNSYLMLDVTATNGFRSLIGTKSGLKRWQIDIGDGNTDGSPTGAGSDFALSRFNDGGSLIGKVLSASRLTGNAVFTNDLNVGIFGGPDRGLAVVGEGYKNVAGMWQAISDARVKTVLGDYPPGLVEIKQLTPKRFRFKGNDVHKSGTPTAPAGQPDPQSPHYAAATAATEYVGMIAQDVEGAMPDMVRNITAYIDGTLVNDMRLLDPTSLVFALVNAVKELAARVEALEAAP